MQKRKYIKPEMEELELQAKSALLQGSSDDEYEGGYGSIIPTEINKQV